MVRAAAAADDRGLFASPATLLLEGSATGPDPTVARGWRVLTTDPTEAAALGADQTIDLPDSLVTPPLVNAHTHLDLTHLGPIAHDPADGFVHWVDRVRAGRLDDPSPAVRDGAEMSVRGGVAVVGDIAGIPHAPSARALARSGLAGVSFAEFFAMGARERQAIDGLDTLLRAHIDAVGGEIGSAVRAGLQPHAPYSVSPGAALASAELAARVGAPLSMHLAETPEERELIAHGTGPQRELLERLGVWEDRILDVLAHGKSPVEHSAPLLERCRELGIPLLAAHVNQASDEDIRRLARAGVSVAYCPRASAYFDAPRHFGPHRYRDMLDSGVNVCLGTDSRLNIPQGQADRISPLDDARLLYARDGVDPATLLAMLTTRGARALGLPEPRVRLRAGDTPRGLLAFPLAGESDPGTLFRSDAMPGWILRVSEPITGP